MIVYNSRYNFLFPVQDGTLLYNSATGGTVLLGTEELEAFQSLLVGSKTLFSTELFPDDISHSFQQNGFIVPETIDEIVSIRERYWLARGETPFVLTITTTQDCNLGCYYCYEERSKDKLTQGDIPALLKALEENIANKKSVHVDWYGGEPLLNLPFLEAASAAIQDFCVKRQLVFHASVISNGTLWPTDLESFIAQHKIRQVQISFDGLRENHNKRRRYLNARAQKEKSSFDEAFALVDRLLNYVHVDVRFNIDQKNQDDLFPFIELMKEKQWFNKTYPAVFQPARISAYTEHSSFLGDYQLTIEQYDALRAAVREKLEDYMAVEESEMPDGFPYPKTSVCAALSNSSFVLGADAHIYRCGLQVGEKLKATGHIKHPGTDFADRTWWKDFDPCKLPSCSKCSFLPVCWGGCPVKHLDSDQHALHEQSLYWRNNLARSVSSFVQKPLLHTTMILEHTDQFREGYE